MLDDRSTGDDRSVGATAVNLRATPQRGVPPREVVFKFRLPVSEDTRTATTKYARHRAIWAAILRSGPGRFESVLSTVPSRDLKGFDAPIRATSKHLTYSMPRRLFLRVATETALSPDEVIGVDGHPISAYETQVAVAASVAYRNALGTLPGPQRELLRSRVAVALEGLLGETAVDNLTVIEALQATTRLADKIGRLDNVALQVLIERDPVHHGQVLKDPYTARNALVRLLVLEWRVDDLLRATEQRTGVAAAAATSLREAIAALEGFDRVWQLRSRLKTLLAANTSLYTTDEQKVRRRLAFEQADSSALPLVSATEMRWLALLTAYRLELAAVGAGPRPEADFDRRLSEFRTHLGKSLVLEATEGLAGLLVRIDDALTRGYPHFEALYGELGTIIPRSTTRRGASSTPLDPALRQRLARLTQDFPLMGYQPLADKAVKDFRILSAPMLRRDYSARQRFAWTMNSDLTRIWRVRTRRLQKILGEETAKVWLADVLVAHTLDVAGVPADDFLRDVAAEKSAEVAGQISVTERVLTVLSVALFFVPGGGALALALRVGALAADAVSIYDQLEDQLEAEAFAGTGLARRAPSGWWLVLSVVSLGTDLGDVARLVGIGPKRLLRAIEEDAVEALLSEYRIERRDLAKKYLRQRRRELADDFFVAAAKSSVLGSGPAFAEGIADAASALVRIGYTRLEEFLVDIRVFTGSAVPDAVLADAFARARKELGVSADGVRIDELQRAVQQRPHAKVEVDRLADLVGRREAAVIEVLEQGDEAALRSADRSLARLKKKLSLAQRDLGRFERLEALLDTRIARLKQQQAELTTLSNEAQFRRDAFPRRRQILLALEKRDQNLRDRLATLRKVKRGEQLTGPQRHRFHEDVASSWLREQKFHRVGDQVTIEVTYRHGKTIKSDVVKVDNLVEVTPGRFRVYDAKWSDSYHSGIGTGRAALTTPAQRRAYGAIADGDVVGVRIVDTAGAGHFGLVSGAEIVVEPRLLLILNQIDGRVRAHVLR